MTKEVPVWIAVINSLPELVLGTCWTAVVFTLGVRFGRWRSARQ
ncbi:hypothetical protein [Mesorhizobium sp. M2A.F.Ca.ET.039.01.1.1]|nr:hypothetical protein [Mesorhizobium sp. M2A.F.Ca.ET.039.01.1.1]